MHPELSALASVFLYLFFLFTIVYLIISKFRSNDKDGKLGKISWYLLFLGGLLIVFSILSPIIIFYFFEAKETLTTNSDNPSLYAQTGPLGDTLGGVMNPFIAIAGVIITGLAFYAQYQANQSFLDANEDLKKQFKLQQFESQFYEMLSLHKENVNEMVIEGYEYDKNVFSDSKKIYKNVSFEKNKDSKNRSNYLNEDNVKEKKEITGRKLFYLMLKEFHANYEMVKKLTNGSNSQEGSMATLKLSYSIFFSGKVIYEKQISNNELGDNFSEDQHKNILKEIEVLRICHKKGVRYIPDYVEKKSLHLDFSYKPFGGHLIRFAHFYRHMYTITNFVVNENNDILSYEDKRKYLKMFRAQLSNHEIVLLYYNWLAGHGGAWEQLIVEEGKGKPNKFFTDYRMIHNLSKHLVLEEFDPEKFFKTERYSSFLYKPGKKK